jgi:hypothetical protein
VAEVSDEEDICAVTSRLHWRVVSLLLGVLSLAVPIGIVASGLVRVAVAPDAGFPRIKDFVLIGYIILFLLQCIHGLIVVRCFGRTAAEARTHRLRVLFLGPIGVFLNVREMTATSNERALPSRKDVPI